MQDGTRGKAMAQDKFMFFENFKSVADKLDDAMRLKFYDALGNYVFNEQDPDDPIISALIQSLKPSLERTDCRGGARSGSGAPKNNQNAKKQSKTIKNNQNNQNNQSFHETETETETETEDNVFNKGGVGGKETKVLDNQSPFLIGGDDWKFSPELLKLAKKHWSNSIIRQIESDYSHRPPTEITIEKLLDEYPSDKVPFKILGEKQSIPLTKRQWEWFTKQGIAPAVKVKAIDLLEEYAVSNPKRFKQYSDLSIIIGRGWAYREAFKEPYKFENQEHLVSELKRVGLK